MKQLRIIRLRIPITLIAILSGCTADTFEPPIDPMLKDTGPGPDVLDDAAAPPDAAQAEGSTSDGGPDADAVTPPTTRRVFVTKKTYAPNFGGLSGGDGICQASASAAGLGGTWMAWLSSSTVDASSRLEHAAVPYVDMTGARIAQNWTELTSGTLERAIDHDATGALAPAELVWTSTLSNGSTSSGAQGACLDWTSADSARNADVGTTAAVLDGGAVGLSWTFSAASPCDASFPLYCIEQL